MATDSQPETAAGGGATPMAVDTPAGTNGNAGGSGSLVFPVDKTLFASRMQRLYKSWKKAGAWCVACVIAKVGGVTESRPLTVPSPSLPPSGSGRNEAVALAFVFGGSSEATYTKSLALMYHLFGVELQHVLMVVLPKSVHLVAAGEDTAQALKATYEGKAGEGDAEVMCLVCGQSSI